MYITLNLPPMNISIYTSAEYHLSHTPALLAYSKVPKIHRQGARTLLGAPGIATTTTTTATTTTTTTTSTSTTSRSKDATGSSSSKEKPLDSFPDPLPSRLHRFAPATAQRRSRPCPLQRGSTAPGPSAERGARGGGCPGIATAGDSEHRW